MGVPQPQHRGVLVQGTVRVMRLGLHGHAGPVVRLGQPRRHWRVAEAIGRLHTRPRHRHARAIPPELLAVRPEEDGVLAITFRQRYIGQAQFLALVDVDSARQDVGEKRHRARPP
jgi:hypothetical protein